MDQDETLQEELPTPFWQRLSLQHLGLLLGGLGLMFAAMGLWLFLTQPAVAAFPEQEAGALALPAAAEADPLAALDSSGQILDEAPGEPRTGESGTEQTAALMTVYVVGAVTTPGVYQVPDGARVNDVVLQAGGLSHEADSLHVNLAERVEDGQQIYVPRLGEAPAAAPAANSQTGGAAPVAETAPDGLLNLNQASASELEALPRIGAALAQRIVEQREANGPFRSIEDLRTIKGISEGVFAEIAPLITVE